MEKQLIEGDRLYLIAESLAKDFSLFPEVSVEQEPIPGLLSQADIDRRNDELAHSSLRFTLGRFTTEEDVDVAVEQLRGAVGKLRELSPLWDMYKDGIDLDTIEWAAH